MNKKRNLSSQAIIIIICIGLALILHIINEPLVEKNESEMLITSTENKSLSKLVLEEQGNSEILSTDDFYVDIKDQAVTFTNKFQEIENLLYAWYIIDKNSNRVIEKTEYSDINSYTYTFQNNGSYIIRGYVRTINNERWAKDFCEILVKEADIELIPYEQNNQSTSNRYDFGIVKGQFNCGFKTPSDDEVLKIAEGLLANTLTVFDSLDSMPYSLQTLDWNVTYSESPSTFQLYLQSLYPLVYLTKAYELTHDINYLDYGKTLIKEWDTYRLSDQAQDNTFVWYDHGTALRAENILYYILSADDIPGGYFSREEKKWLYNMIWEHGEFLANESNYTENHNHGIFQDQALIYCAYFLNGSDKEMWLDIAKKRLEEQKSFAFTDEMVHVENSPGYQIGVMDLFRTIADFLKQFDDDFGNILYEDIKKSAEFMAYIMKPNGIVAEIGDTNSLITSSNVSNSKLTIFDNAHLTYASSLGKSGVKPEQKARCYPDSGYYLRHNSWEEKDYSMATWMMFKSGYVSKTHKHADDNSFMLYSKGYDIFVDPGWYNYISGNRYRDYFVSSLAHNTVIVDQKTYSPTVENSIKTGIYSYETNNNFDYILGYNEMYNGVKFDRHYYSLGDAIIIYDNILSEEKHMYSQLFHASEYMEIVSTSEQEILFSLGNDNKYFVRVKQLLDNGKFTVEHGDYGENKYGYISREINHLDTIDTLKYEVLGDNIDIITLITIEDKDRNVMDISEISFDKQKRKFTVEKNKEEKFDIQLTERKRINTEYYEVAEPPNLLK